MQQLADLNKINYRENLKNKFKKRCCSHAGCKQEFVFQVMRKQFQLPQKTKLLTDLLPVRSEDKEEILKNEGCC